MTTETPLGANMRRLANEVGAEVAQTITLLADELETAIEAFDAKKVLGAWARARRVYAHFSGEDLV